jgi:hypothetical protein
VKSLFDGYDLEKLSTLRGDRRKTFLTLLAHVLIALKIRTDCLELRKQIRKVSWCDPKIDVDEYPKSFMEFETLKNRLQGNSMKIKEKPVHSIGKSFCLSFY